MENQKGKQLKYVQLMADLKEKILSGEILPGEKIPSENILAAQYQVSRQTVRKAIAIMENEGYGAIRQTCKNFFHGIDFGCSPQTGVSCPDFLKVARAFGFEADVCDNIDQLDEKLDQFLNCTKPFVLLVRQQLDDPVLPKLMSKLDHNGKMTSPKLHDMYPFVSEEDMKWLLPYE